MKLKQVGEGFKICPNCKKRTLMLALSKKAIERGMIEMGFYRGEGTTGYGYHYECKNCDARFIDEDLIKKQKGGKINEKRARG